MNKSDSIAKLAMALVGAQAEMRPAPLNAKNPFLGNNYADLGSLIETSKPILAKWHLAISQFLNTVDGRLGLSTMLIHESGEFLEMWAVLPIETKKGLSVSQEAGVSISYFRRYAWAAVLGMYAGDDLDGVAPKEEKQLEKEEKPRTWPDESITAVLESKVAETESEAQDILNFSMMPENAGIKTVQSWLKYYAAAGKDSIMECADVANQAYLKAKKGVK